MPATDRPDPRRRGRAVAVVVVVALEVLVLLHSERVGAGLLACTAILLLTAYTFRPSRPPGTTPDR